MTIHGTTICAVRKDGKVAIAGDGQATSGEGGIVMKGNCRKVRRLYTKKAQLLEGQAYGPKEKESA